MVAETVSLGILSLPSVIASVGLVPGIVLILFVGALATYSGLVIGQFVLKYPHVQNFGDAGEVIGRPMGCGRFLQEFFGWAQTIFQVFVMGSHLLTWTICLNTLTDSSMCTMIWAVVGLAIFFILNLPRTFKQAKWMSVASFCSIFTAVMITVGDVAVEKPIGDASIEIARAMPFTTAFLSVTNIAIAFCGHSCFFGIISEMKKPEDWPKALALLQICDTTLYLAAAIVIYVFVGPSVPSPALTAAGSVLMRKIIWGIAIPTILIAGVIYGHVAAKYVFDRVFRNTEHIARRTLRGTLGWIGIVGTFWILALVIAESIPVFNSLLGLICALFASWFSFGIPGMLWLSMNRGEYFKDGKKMAAFAANAFLVVVGAMICVLGLWSSGTGIAGSKAAEPWSCKSNV